MRRPRTSSWVEVDLAAIRGNVEVVRELAGPGCGVWAVVKADGYGHGAVPVSRAAVEGGAAGLVVSAFEEAAELRRGGIEAPVLLVSAGETGRAGEVVRRGIIQTAVRPEMIRALSRAAQRLGREARVHLKVDTGFGRLGVKPEKALETARLIVSLPGLRLEGVLTHFASSEEPDSSYTELQFERFSQAVAALAGAGIGPGVRHAANSAAALRFPQMRLEGVRTGLLVYGIHPGGAAPELPALRPALTWKTRLAFTQWVRAGSQVSYGGTYVTQRESLVGVLPVGYAHGYPRRASSRAQVLVRGQRCPVIGRVCMAHVMIDATAVGEAQPGDEVVLLGRQGENQVTANDLAQWADTCVHEVTTVIAPRVRRVYTGS